MNQVYLLLGANLGEPKQQIERARRLIEQKIGTVIRQSSVYISEAWGIEDQPIFFNQVLEVSTTLVPKEVLEASQQIENDLGRVRKEKWGSRMIDIDILYYNEDIIKEDRLKIPHPYIQDRNFTLIPLVEIAPAYIHPIWNKSNEDLLSLTTDKLSVQKAPMTDFQFIKPEQIRANMMNNDEMVKTFVSMYLSQCGQDFENLSKAIDGKDHTEIASKAHHIKPTMEYIGATDIRMQFQQVENMAKGQEEITEILRYFEKLEDDFNTLMEELKTFYASLD